MELLTWLESTWLAQAITTEAWMYPAFESAHYVGLAMLVGAIMLIDLRLLGFAKILPIRAMVGLLPWVWAGFVVNVLSGTAMFVYGATNFGTNPSFGLKMAFMVLAGVNALIFTVAAARSGDEWIDTGQVPGFVKVVATASLVLWLCVVTTGRWMAYV